MTHNPPLSVVADTIPIDVAHTLIAAYLPGGSHFGEIRHGVLRVLRAYRGSAAWRARVVATAFKG